MSLHLLEVDQRSNDHTEINKITNNVNYNVSIKIQGVSDCCIMQNEQFFFSYNIVRTI